MLEENLAGGTVMGLMRCQGGWGPLLESRGSQLALFAQKKDIVALAASVSPQPEPWVHRTCLHMFCFLGNAPTYHVIGTDNMVRFDRSAMRYCCSQD